jgi:threonine/homoserine/homoserine lactone efflux protein
MESISLFIITVLTILGVPGPTNTLLATSGAAVGWRGSLKLIPAEACGYLTTILLLGFVLGPVIAGSPIISTALRLAVGVYLCMLAYRLWGDGAAQQTGATAITVRRLFVATMLNPKAIVFALGVIPFGKPHVTAYLLGFVAMVAMVGTGWLFVGDAAGQMARAGGKAQWVPRIGAAVVTVFAMLVVVSPLMK